MYCLLIQNLNRKSTFAALHSDINSLKSGLLHLTGQPNSQKGILAKAKVGIVNLILRNYVVDKYTGHQFQRLEIAVMVESEVSIGL